jgi:Xaa-Pro aminopeptidase
VEVRDAAIDLIRPGVIACDIVEKVAKHVAGFQLGTMDIGGAYRLGHGCGPSLDEWPSLNSLSRTVLREGMGLAVHPIIYVPYLHSLFMLGEYVLVTENGHEVLTKRQTEILTI